MRFGANSISREHAERGLHREARESMHGFSGLERGVIGVMRGYGVDPKSVRFIEQALRLDA